MKLRSLLLGLLLSASGLAHGAIALVQHISTRCTTTPCAVTLSGVASGDTLIIQTVIVTSASFTSITDSNGTVSTAKASSGPNTVAEGVYYVANTASGTHALTLTVSSNVNMELFVSEYSGLATAPLDVASTEGNGSSTSPLSGSITPVGNGELLAGFIALAGSSVTFSSWGSSLIQVDTQAGGPTAAWAAFVQGTGTSGSASATASASAFWVAIAVFFKAAPPYTAPPTFVISNGHALISKGNPVVVN